MFEIVIFNIVAFSLFIIILSKIVKKKDLNYLFILVLSAIGILLSLLKVKKSAILIFIRYIFSIVIPCAIIAIEKYGFNFSELLSIFLAKIMILFNNTKKAKQILTNLTSKYPKSYMGHKLLAEIYKQEGGMRKAIDEYVIAVDINKRDYKSYFIIAELLNDLGKKDEATEMLENLLKTKPDCYEASYLLGELLCEQEKFKEAVNVYQQALIYKPAEWDLYYNLGILYTRLSDFQNAKDMYEKAASINHKLYGANYGLGQIAFIQRELEASEKYFEDSLYEEYEPLAYYQLAKVYVLKSQKDRAITFLNKAIELDSKLLQKANKEKIFEDIKQYISVSVKMDDKKGSSSGGSSLKSEKDKNILKNEEEKARDYLDEAAVIIDSLNENASKQKAQEFVDRVLSQELKKAEESKVEINEEKREENEVIKTETINIKKDNKEIQKEIL